MNRSLLGVPLVLLFFVGILLVPLLISDYFLYRELKAAKCANVAPMTVVVNPTATPTATPSATLSPTKAKTKVIQTTPTTAK